MQKLRDEFSDFEEKAKGLSAYVRREYSESSEKKIPKGMRMEQ